MVNKLSSGHPTSGRVVDEEITEWARQARRWTIGAGKVFHYYMNKSKRIPFFTALSWGLTFISYYGILLCYSHLYGVTLSISYAFFLSKDAVIFGTPISYLIIHVSLYLLYSNSLSMFILDRLCPKLLVPQPEEYISTVRNISHFVISPLVIIGYSLIEFWSIHELAIRGKKVCSHKPSKNTKLVMTNIAKFFIAPIMTPTMTQECPNSAWRSGPAYRMSHDVSHYENTEMENLNFLLSIMSHELWLTCSNME